MCEKYQGWKNYETWGIALIINNDAGSYEYFNEICRDAYDGPVIYDETERLMNAANAMREEMKDLFEDMIEDFKQIETHSFMLSIIDQITDFSNSSTIDWENIARHILGVD